MLAHGLGAARDLLGRLALYPQRDEEPSDLGGCRLSSHDLAHHVSCLRPAEVGAVEQPRERDLDHRRLSAHGERVVRSDTVLLAQARFWVLAS